MCMASLHAIRKMKKKKTDAPRRAVDNSHDRLFGGSNRAPATPAKSHHKSNIPFGSDATDNAKVTNGNGHINGNGTAAAAAAAAPALNGNGHANGNGNGNTNGNGIIHENGNGIVKPVAQTNGHANGVRGMCLLDIIALVV